MAANCASDGCSAICQPGRAAAGACHWAGGCCHCWFGVIADCAGGAGVNTGGRVSASGVPSGGTCMAVTGGGICIGRGGCGASPDCAIGAEGGKGIGCAGIAAPAGGVFAP